MSMNDDLKDNSSKKLLKFDKKYLIQDSKTNEFLDFLESDDSGKILELLDAEGLEYLRTCSNLTDRIKHILGFSKYCNELLQNEKFLALFFSVRIDFYINMTNIVITTETYEAIIKYAIKNNISAEFIVNVVTMNNFDDKHLSDVIDRVSLSEEMIYELFKKTYDLSLKIKIIQKYNIDLLSHGIDLSELFNQLKVNNIRAHQKSKRFKTVDFPQSKVNKEMARYLWSTNYIFEYREVINSAEYSCDPTVLNDYAKKREDYIISGASSTSLLPPYDRIYSIFCELNNNNTNSYSLHRELMKLCKGLNSQALEMLNEASFEARKELLAEFSNCALSDYIIDYHFEENYYNIIYDLRELLDFYYAGNINLPEERLHLYNQISHIDELPIEEKKVLHEELKKHNIMELFYDDMAFARKIVRNAIKESALSSAELVKYKNEKLSEEYGVDVFQIEDNNPFFALVKSGEHQQNEFPGGYSYSLVGNGCVATFGLESYVYDSADLNPDQVVHVFPKDSYTYYAPFSGTDKSSRKVQTLMMPDELLLSTTNYGLKNNFYNELLILEEGTTKTYENIPRLRRIALFCVDHISSLDAEKAKEKGIGILLVPASNYHEEMFLPNSFPKNIYRHREREYYNYEYYSNLAFEQKFNERIKR